MTSGAPRRLGLLLASFLGALSLSVVLDMTRPVAATADEGDATELAKKLQNPVASLNSVPFHSNFDSGIGPRNDGFRYTLNVQPVIPISLTTDLNLITRVILPVIYQTDIFPGSGDQFGLGDTTASFFLSPSKPLLGSLILGVGPVFLLPTGTDDLLSARKWGAGPTLVALTQQGPWTVGILANHIWSFAGDDDRPPVSSTFLQPFLAYALPGAVTLSLNTESTYDWKSEQWTVPIQLGVSKVFKFGKLPVSLGLNGRYWAERPDSAPEWGIRFIATFLFPK